MLCLFMFTPDLGDLFNHILPDDFRDIVTIVLLSHCPNSWDIK